MIGHKLISWPGTMRDFVFGQSYTRGAIRQALGGDLSSSLPHRDGRESSRRSVSSYRAS